MCRRIGALVIAVACAAALVACEGPEGPEGPAGPPGPPGPAGTAGPAGQDANENCTQCHVDDVTLVAKQIQYAQSTHRLGGNFERNATSCAICHTHQGFLERAETNASSTAETVEDPVPVNCRTCHQIHTTYTAADYAFTVTSPFPLYNEDYDTGEQITVDFGDMAGNLCARCHQGRSLTSRVAGGVVPVIDGPDVEITSSRYGIHHGPQAQVLAGVGAYEFTGSETVTGGPFAHGNPDVNEKLCATCHMATATGVEFGGHTWRMSFTSNGNKEENTAGCNNSACHAGAISDFSTVQDEVLGLMQDLEQLLVDLGIKQGLTPGYTLAELAPYANAGVWSANLAAAMLNWQVFAEDRSRGLHNPAYARAVLTNTIEAITPP